MYEYVYIHIYVYIPYIHSLAARLKYLSEKEVGALYESGCEHARVDDAFAACASHAGDMVGLSLESAPTRQVDS